MKAIIIYGPPGSGKGTQAKLLADKFGLIHFDTGKHIEQIIFDPQNSNNEVIKKQRQLFDAGILCEPSWVLKIVKEQVRRLALVGLSVIFSGSPRTFYEAFGDKKQKGLIDVLERFYGKKNIFIFNINLSEKNSIKRNSNRLVCSVCKSQLLANFKNIKRIERCPFCGGELYRRTLDKPEIIKIRLREYRERTLPIEKELKKRGYKIIDIDGGPLPEKIHKKMSSYLTEND